MTRSLVLMTEHLDVAAFAAAAGLKPATIHSFRHRGILPEPAFYAGQSPVWTRKQVDKWLKTRRKRGHPKG